MLIYEISRPNGEKYDFYIGFKDQFEEYEELETEIDTDYSIALNRGSFTAIDCRDISDAEKILLGTILEMMLDQGVILDDDGDIVAVSDEIDYGNLYVELAKKLDICRASGEMDLSEAIIGVVDFSNALRKLQSLDLISVSEEDGYGLSATLLHNIMSGEVNILQP